MEEGRSWKRWGVQSRVRERETVPGIGVVGQERTELEGEAAGGGGGVGRQRGRGWAFARLGACSVSPR